MPRKYDKGTRAEAVRLVVEHAGDYASENEAVKTVAGPYCSADGWGVRDRGSRRAIQRTMIVSPDARDEPVSK